MNGFRVVAVVLLLIIAAEVWGILNTDTHERELVEAIARYNRALEINETLKEELSHVGRNL